MEIKENQITIFKNTKKAEGSKQPEYTGKLNVGGIIKDVSLWVKEGKNGKFFSGLIKDEWKPTQQAEAPQETPSIAPTEDDLPF